LSETPANWAEQDVQNLLDVAEAITNKTIEELNLRGKAIRKRRSVGLVPNLGQEIPRESLDEAVLRVHEVVNKMNEGRGPGLPYCSFNGGNDAWVDVGNKRVGVQILQSYLGIAAHDTLHIGDQFLNTGNDFAARTVAPCIWITNPQETTYILKSILRLAGVPVRLPTQSEMDNDESSENEEDGDIGKEKELQPTINFDEIERRTKAAQLMDVYTGEMLNPTK
jgi:hypothetical protein